MSGTKIKAWERKDKEDVFGVGGTARGHVDTLMLEPCGQYGDWWGWPRLGAAGAHVCGSWDPLHLVYFLSGCGAVCGSLGPRIMVCLYNPRMREAEAGGSLGQAEKV